MTLSIMVLDVECCYATFRDLLIIILNVIMLSVIMLNVVAPNFRLSFLVLVVEKKDFVFEPKFTTIAN